jgi:hypothetical protein
MVTHYDEKGKIFTQVVAKQPVKVIIQTVQNLIHGMIHIHPDLRVKDALDGTDRFMAVTDAVVYNNLHEVVFRTAFMIINTSHIIWAIPEEEIVP